MRWLLTFCLLFLPFFVLAQEGPALTPAEAVKKIDEKVTVEMEVKSAKDQREKAGVVYLDSHDNFRSPENLAVVINRSACGKFKEAGVTDIAGKYKEQKIRVTGMVVKKDNRVQLIVSDPKQIVILEKK